MCVVFSLAHADLLEVELRQPAVLGASSHLIPTVWSLWEESSAGSLGMLDKVGVCSDANQASLGVGCASC